jgi:hypothetical protein
MDNYKPHVLSKAAEIVLVSLNFKRTPSGQTLNRILSIYTTFDNAENNIKSHTKTDTTSKSLNVYLSHV